MKYSPYTLFSFGITALSALSLSAQTHRAPEAGNPSCVQANPQKEVSKINLLATPNATLYSHGDPTAEEQYTLELINRARANPAEEGERLANTTDPEVLSSYSYFKINTNLVKTQFASYPSRPPLAFNEKLIRSARKHSDWMKANNTQSHTGANGSSPFDRINAEGYTGWTAAGENVGAYLKSLWYGHAGFNVDWGEQNQVDLGHRANIMNFKTTIFTEIGVGITLASGGQGKVGPMIITHNFGKRADYFLTGVVYKDNNNNGFYDVGEGVPGVTITPNKGNFYAVTSTSGGYAIPMTNVSGSVSVTASGTGIGGSATKSVSFSGQNVKLDFTSALPGNVSLVYPADSDIIQDDNVKFSWMKSTGVSKYWFELSEKADFSTTVKLDSTLSDTTFSFKNLSNGKTYFWRVKAKTSAGWGDFSESRTFSVEMQVASKVELDYPQDESSGNVIPDFSWYAASPDVTAYWIDVAEDNAFEKLVLQDTNVTATTKKATFEYKNDVYYWRVRAKNKFGWGEYSEVWKFFMIPSNILENAAQFKLQNSPNPFEKATNITFTLLKDQNVTLRIHNATGQEIFTTLLKDAREGENTFVWNAEGFENGVYYYAIEADGMKGVRPMILVK